MKVRQQNFDSRTAEFGQQDGRILDRRAAEYGKEVGAGYQISWQSNIERENSRILDRWAAEYRIGGWQNIG